MSCTQTFQSQLLCVQPTTQHLGCPGHVFYNLVSLIVMAAGHEGQAGCGSVLLLKTFETPFKQSHLA